LYRITRLSLLQMRNVDGSECVKDRSMNDLVLRRCVGSTFHFSFTFPDDFLLLYAYLLRIYTQRTVVFFTRSSPLGVLVRP
jgi:hypothetical protein